MRERCYLAACQHQAAQQGDSGKPTREANIYRRNIATGKRFCQFTYRVAAQEEIVTSKPSIVSVGRLVRLGHDIRVYVISGIPAEASTIYWDALTPMVELNFLLASALSATGPCIQVACHHRYLSAEAILLQPDR